MSNVAFGAPLIVSTQSKQWVSVIKNSTIRMDLFQNSETEVNESARDHRVQGTVLVSYRWDLSIKEERFLSIEFIQRSFDQMRALLPTPTPSLLSYPDLCISYFMLEARMKTYWLREIILNDLHKARLEQSESMFNCCKILGLCSLLQTLYKIKAKFAHFSHALGKAVGIIQ